MSPQHSSLKQELFYLARDSVGHVGDCRSLACLVSTALSRVSEMPRTPSQAFERLSSRCLGSPVCGFLSSSRLSLIHCLRCSQDFKCKKRACARLRDFGKPLFAACLLMSYWPKQLTWPSPQSLWEGMAQECGYRKVDFAVYHSASW